MIALILTIGLALLVVLVAVQLDWEAIRWSGRRPSPYDHDERRPALRSFPYRVAESLGSPGRGERRLGLVLGLGLVAILACLVLLADDAAEKLRLRDASAAWPTTQAAVRAVGVARGSARDTWRPVIRYGYTVDGRRYESDVWRVYANTVGSETQARAIAGAYAVGQQISIRYRPENPAWATIEPGSLDGFDLLGPAAILLLLAVLAFFTIGLLAAVGIGWSIVWRWRLLAFAAALLRAQPSAPRRVTVRDLVGPLYRVSPHIIQVAAVACFGWPAVGPLVGTPLGPSLLVLLGGLVATTALLPLALLRSDCWVLREGYATTALVLSAEARATRYGTSTLVRWRVDGPAGAFTDTRDSGEWWYKDLRDTANATLLARARRETEECEMLRVFQPHGIDLDVGDRPRRSGEKHVSTAHLLPVKAVSRPESGVYPYDAHDQEEGPCSQSRRAVAQRRRTRRGQAEADNDRAEEEKSRHGQILFGAQPVAPVEGGEEALVERILLAARDLVSQLRLAVDEVQNTRELFLAQPEGAEDEAVRLILIEIAQDTKEIDWPTRELNVAIYHGERRGITSVIHHRGRHHVRLTTTIPYALLASRVAGNLAERVAPEA